MQNYPSIQLVTRLREEDQEAYLQKYLDKGYSIDHISKVESFEDGTVALRIYLIFTVMSLETFEE